MGLSSLGFVGEGVAVEARLVLVEDDLFRFFFRLLRFVRVRRQQLVAAEGTCNNNDLSKPGEISVWDHLSNQVKIIFV